MLRQRYEDVFRDHDRRAERDRLTALAEELDPATEARLDALGPQPGWRCLEVGAGSGTIAAWLAGRCLHGHVVATDVDLRFLDAGARPNLEVLEHDVTADDFPPASFDLIHARYVFVHLRDRDQILRRVASWLAPGGWLLIEEPARFPIESSPHLEYREVTLAALDAFRARMGTDTCWPRSFPAPLAAAGLGELSVAGSTSTVGGGRPMARFWASTLRRIAGDLAVSGRMSRLRVDRVAELMRRDEFWDLGMATIAAWGRRPDARA